MMMKFIILLMLFNISVVTRAKPPPLNPYEAAMRAQSTGLGLYDPTDKVVILTSANFKDEIINRNRSSLVEFYNSYCGHCKRFAPVYKQLAEFLHSWRDYLLVGAIDCASEENTDICREYEIMGYPSLRFMASNFTPAAKHYGRDVESQAPVEIKKLLANWLLEEHSNLQAMSYEQAEDLLAHAQKMASSDVYNIVVYEPVNSTIGIQTKLHFLSWPQVNIWHTSDERTARLFELNDKECITQIGQGQGGKVNCSEFKNPLFAKYYINAIEDMLHKLHVTESPEVTPVISLNNTHLAVDYNKSDIISYVKSRKHLVYQADLEMAVHTMLTTEVPRAADISGEKLLALRRMLAVIKRYQPLSQYGSGNQLIARLYNFTMEFASQLSGQQFEVETKRLEEVLTKPIFVADSYVGCVGSKANSRGFTCALWQLFHYLTVQAASDMEAGSLDVLEAIHGYVKHFFGCSDCSQHFQEMSVKRNIWNVADKDSAVIWLWSAHNEVNNRLRGDTTEDVEFPKIQFPSEESCSTCHQTPSSLLLNNKTEDDLARNNWNRTAVLMFLKDIHNRENISLYGIKYLNISSSMEQMQHKRLTSNAFSDLDMRVGMLLYAFCIVMIVLAFKLFALRGSHRRKNNYSPNDLLGKV